MSSSVTLEHIYLAAKRLKGHINHTPCHNSSRLSHLVGANVFLKMENTQHTGAYKERGALNKLRSLTEEERNLGVFAASAGNHAQGLAYHAGRLGIKSTIFMPLGTPVIKVTRTKFYGANVIQTGHSFDEANQACIDHLKTNGGVLVPPFDDFDIIAGQGTIGLEIMDQVPDVDVLVVPIGGGGLISGIARAAKSINPNIRIVGVEPAKIPSMAKAVGGDLSVQPAVTTIADGINVRKVGTHTLKMCQELVDEYVSVTDEEICRAILQLLEGDKAVAEGAGAAGVAALMSHKVKDIAGKRVGTIVSGGNIDVNIIAQVIECGLIDSGRRVKLCLDIPDRPGTLVTLISLISQMQANVVSVTHERTRMATFGSATVHLTLDVRGEEHQADILAALKGAYKDDTISFIKNH